MIEFTCVSVILIGIGLLSIFARDMMWEITHWSNRVEGVASERTEHWDTGSIISGVIAIVVGAGLLIYSLGTSS